MTSVEKIKTKRDFWKQEEESIIQQWADRAQCYQWMHSRCREIYQRKNALFTIPVIIISTITGTANFAQDRFSDDIKPYVVMSIGALSIIAGIITTIYQFLKISELNEGHRVAQLSWTKFYNNLRTELLRHPLDRMNSTMMIKHCKEEYERLIEISPFINKKVISSFNSKFKKETNLFKPEIGNKLIPTAIFEMTDLERQEMINKINNVKAPVKLNTVVIDEQRERFKNTFLNLNNRVPTDKEIQEHLKKFNINDLQQKQSETNNVNGETSDSDSENNSNGSVSSNGNPDSPSGSGPPDPPGPSGGNVRLEMEV